jgi:hypothetical protein
LFFARRGAARALLKDKEQTHLKSCKVELKINEAPSILPNATDTYFQFMEALEDYASLPSSNKSRNADELP